MKVIFIQNVAKQGRIGEIKEVSDGFAVNVLIPKKQAIIATGAAIKKIQEEKSKKASKVELDKNLFLRAIVDLQNILDKDSEGKLEILGHKADKTGHLFSQIRESDVVDAIYKKIKVSLNPDQVILPKEHIKKQGEYEIEIKDQNNKRKLKMAVK